MLAERITSPSTDLSSPKMPTPLESSKSTLFHQNTRRMDIPNESMTRAACVPRRPSSIFIPRVFMVLQNPSPATPFLSHLYKTGGVRGRPQIKMENHQAGFQRGK